MKKKFCGMLKTTVIYVYMVFILGNLQRCFCNMNKIVMNTIDNKTVQCLRSNLVFICDLNCIQLVWFQHAINQKDCFCFDKINVKWGDKGKSENRQNINPHLQKLSRGCCTAKSACFVLYLKIINIFLKIYALSVQRTPKQHQNFGTPMFFFYLSIQYFDCFDP